MVEGRKFLKLNDLSSYKLAYNLSNYIWQVVIKWNYFEKDTVGKQLVRAADSISANIAEGFGRYSKKDKIKFFRISQGSIKETLDWNEKSKTRGLIGHDEYDKILAELLQLEKEINHLIKFTNEKLTI
ncbi:MAG: four helix bundle protein [Bacteroidales bacterium]|nr:four helix bundle protein [Lentimicrobiaceae bacterium]MDD5695071.1 four helix bundle protein [Bacteroidales bacterium]